MQVQVNKKLGNYFISDGIAIKIGKAGDIDQRLSDLQTGNSQPLILLSYIPCTSQDGMSAEERKSQNHFMKYHLQGEWYSITEEQVYEYSDERGGIILNEEYKQERRTPTVVSTIFGPENGRESIPYCYFYPEQCAHGDYKFGGLDHAPKFRSIRYPGVKEDHPSYAGKSKDGISRVYISAKKWSEYSKLVKAETIETIKKRLDKKIKASEKLVSCVA